MAAAKRKPAGVVGRAMEHEPGTMNLGIFLSRVTGREFFQRLPGYCAVPRALLSCCANVTQISVAPNPRYLRRTGMPWAAR